MQNIIYAKDSLEDVRASLISSKKVGMNLNFTVYQRNLVNARASWLFQRKRQVTLSVPKLTDQMIEHGAG